ncbi:hypothetical protein BDR07DRAFT_1382467 [Suillus spraguei]|nr:hypothetical protein BDR07DRAFT_1382467 [Suillus spraguei]
MLRIGGRQWDGTTRHLQSSRQGGQDLGSEDRQRAVEAMQRKILRVVPESQEIQFQNTHQAAKKRTAHQVIKEERKADILQQIHEEIEEETGQKPAPKEVLRRYQPTMKAIMQWLDKKELQEDKAKADEWTNQAPDATVQAKTARKRGKKW